MKNYIKFIPYAVIAILIVILFLTIPSKQTEIQKLYLEKGAKIDQRLVQETKRNEAQAKIDAINGDIQQIDSKLFDAINGTTSGTGLIVE